MINALKETSLTLFSLIYLIFVGAGTVGFFIGSAYYLSTNISQMINFAYSNQIISSIALLASLFLIAKRHVIYHNYYAAINIVTWVIGMFMIINYLN